MELDARLKGGFCIGIDTGPVGAYRPACQAGLPGWISSISFNFLLPAWQAGYQVYPLAFYYQPDRPACQAGYQVYP